MTSTFSMPMFRPFVPSKLRPWVYVFFAFTFQLSGGMYLGARCQKHVSGRAIGWGLVAILFFTAVRYLSQGLWT